MKPSISQELTEARAAKAMTPGLRKAEGPLSRGRERAAEG
jgi:hypothetical protein